MQVRLILQVLRCLSLLELVLPWFDHDELAVLITHETGPVARRLGLEGLRPHDRILILSG